ncbi:unnamed protein product [Lathyrus oleraceus]|uniref:Uncharacterized protein n=1 Tax=Pisum sativum TaxID=3888 RepID=A0A9D5BJM2_PEA|nr:uncharacterized protein LOC127131980 [Pisum sativum]KAI5444959.1 hypothetical protein KIW84_013296 [Pisum sativum]
MPSGPKKRKAARRKKELNHSLTNNPPQGNDDLKPRNAKVSDGRDDNLSAYHENGDIPDRFNDGSEVVHERAPLTARPIASDVASAKEVCGKKDSVVMIKKDLRSKDGYEKENGRLEHIETAKESCYESGISNGEALAEKNSKDEIYNLLEEKTACHELVKPNESSPSNTIVASMSGVAKCNTGVAPLLEVIGLAGKMNRDNVYPLSNANATASSLEEPKPKESNSRVLTSSSRSPLTNGAVHTKNSETPECSKNQSSVRSAPNLVQKTSWWSCCGMFEVLSGSNR